MVVSEQVALGKSSLVRSMVWLKLLNGLDPTNIHSPGRDPYVFIPFLARRRPYGERVAPSWTIAYQNRSSDPAAEWPHSAGSAQRAMSEPDTPPNLRVEGLDEMVGALVAG